MIARLLQRVPRFLEGLKRFRDWIAEPPYYGVPWLVWLYAFVSLFTYTRGEGVLTGHIMGFDDKIRMTQVLNWINGASWYDRVITRVDPPYGFQTIWARIVDIPIALVVLLAQQFTDQRTAALIASVVVPYTELAVLFVVAIWAARPLVGKNNARLVTLFLMFTTVLNPKQYSWAGFHAGEASHRSWYVILNVLMMGAMVRIALGARGHGSIFLLSLAIGLSLAVGIEGFPMIAGTAAILAMIAWYYGDAALAQRAAMGVGGGAALSLMLLPMHQPPEHWFDVSFAEPSILGPVLVGTAALYFVAESWIVSRFPKKAITALSLISLATLAGFALICIFPKMLIGPAAALSPMERLLAYQEHQEVWPMYRVAYSKMDFVTLAAPTVIALVAGIIALRGARTRRRRILYASYLGFTALAGGLAQVIWRYYHHALPAACPWLLRTWSKMTARLTQGRNYTLLACLSFVAIGPFWMLFLPALENDLPMLSRVVFFPVATQTMMRKCDILALSKYLNTHYDQKTTIIVPSWSSAQFTYYTNLTVNFLANYPSQDRFIDNRLFFTTKDPREAAYIARRHNIGLAAVCPYLKVSSIPANPSMVERMHLGKTPAWLKRIVLGPEGGHYRLFKIDREMLMKDTFWVPK